MSTADPHEHLLIEAKLVKPGDLLADSYRVWEVASVEYPVECVEARVTGSRGWDEYALIRSVPHADGGSTELRIHGDHLQVVLRETAAHRRLTLLREAWPALVALGDHYERTGADYSAAEMADLIRRVGDELLRSGTGMPFQDPPIGG